MKFSYSLLKKILGTAPPKSEVINALSLYAFETEDLGGDTLEVGISPNRYSDASSHLGIAREIAAIYNSRGLSDKLGRYVSSPKKIQTGKKLVTVSVDDAKLCPRYIARYFDISPMGESPAWMKQTLQACGLKSINIIVDIMNYVMLEIGQPLHAFGADKLATSEKRPASPKRQRGEQATGMKEIIVRHAKAGEPITILDGQKYTLKSSDLVIADARHALAIAGIKGGLDSGVSEETKAIVVEAANFQSTNIFQTSRALGLQTDASLRFSHGLSSELAELGMNRVSELLEKFAGAKMRDSIDKYPKKQNQEIIGFSVAKCNSLLGLSLTEREMSGLLKRLGFVIINKKKSGYDFLVQAPLLRLDVTIFEDLVEEVSRLYGYAKIPATAPTLSIVPGHDDEAVSFKELTRTILTGLGLSEVYNSTFISKGEVAILNPIAENKEYLRTNLEEGLRNNLHSNLRFIANPKIFEIGKIFTLSNGQVRERWSLTLGMAHKEKESPVFELKGVLDELMRRLGLVDFEFKENNHGLHVYVDAQDIGCLHRGVFDKEGQYALATLDFEALISLTEGEREYEPIPKFPTIGRDISLLVDSIARAGEILEQIQAISPEYVQDVDMLDYFEDEKLGDNKKSLTFRIVFRSDAKTLTDAEVDIEMRKIEKVLQTKFGAEVR